MGRITITIPDELEMKFREIAYKKFGPKRGNLSRSIEEAIKEWVEKNQEKLER